MRRKAQVSDPLVLSGTLGSEQIYGARRDIPASNKMTLAKVDGTTSFYIVYSDPETNWCALWIAQLRLNWDILQGQPKVGTK